MGISTKNINYHGLGKELLIKAIENLENPLAIYIIDKDNYLIVTELVYKLGKDIISIKLNGRGRYNGVFIDEHQIKSIYGRRNFKEYISNSKYIYKKEESDLGEGIQYTNVADSSYNESIR